MNESTSQVVLNKLLLPIKVCLCTKKIEYKNNIFLLLYAITPILKSQFFEAVVISSEISCSSLNKQHKYTGYNIT